MYRGKTEDVSQELFSDAVMFSLFYIGNFFSNKNGLVNYVMPFTAEELGCSKNDLNVLLPEGQREIDVFEGGDDFAPFDFREFMAQFEFSTEAKDLYNAALMVFRYYHSSSKYENKDWNDSFYDVTNAIMGKDPSQFKDFETDNDRRVNKTKTIKGTKGFGRRTIKYVVGFEDLPIFIDFFDKRDVLAKKINRQLVDSGLLLWERENIY